MTAPQDPAAARSDRLRVGHADREQAIETLKNAFVHGRLTKGELDTRAGQALTARTRADLAALTSDIPPAPAAASPASPTQPARPGRPPAAARPRPLTRAATGSGICLVIAAAAIRIAFLLDPGPDGPPGPPPAWASPSLFLLVAFAAVLAALGILVVGVITATEQRRSRSQLPPLPRPSGHPPRRRTARRHRRPVTACASRARSRASLKPAERLRHVLTCLFRYGMSMMRDEPGTGFTAIRHQRCAPGPDVRLRPWRQGQLCG